MTTKGPICIVETPEFIRRSKTRLTEPERLQLIDYLSLNPASGTIIPGTGGARKLRWAVEGRGKSGGTRVIYYFHNQAVPLFLLSMFAKNERSDLTQAERNLLRELLGQIAEHYSKGARDLVRRR